MVLGVVELWSLYCTCPAWPGRPGLARDVCEQRWWWVTTLDLPWCVRCRHRGTPQKLPGVAGQHRGGKYYGTTVLPLGAQFVFVARSLTGLVEDNRDTEPLQLALQHQQKAFQTVLITKR